MLYFFQTVWYGYVFTIFLNFFVLGFYAFLFRQGKFLFFWLKFIFQSFQLEMKFIVIFSWWIFHSFKLFLEFLRLNLISLGFQFKIAHFLGNFVSMSIFFHDLNMFFLDLILHFSEFSCELTYFLIFFNIEIKIGQ